MDLHEMANSVRHASNFNAAWYSPSARQSAVNAPDEYYACPDAIVRNSSLSRPEKASLLALWRQQLEKRCRHADGIDGPDVAVEKALIEVTRAQCSLRNQTPEPGATI